MSNKKDYANLSLDELLTEEKKTKRNDTISSVLIGFCIGVIVYAVVKNNIGFVSVFVPIFLITGIYKNSQNLKNDLKEIESEIIAKK